MTAKDNIIDQLDAVRLALLSAVEEKGESLSGLSSSLGKNPAYLQQYVRRGSPRKLPEDVRQGLARLLDINEMTLGGTNSGNNKILPEPATTGHRKSLRGFAVRLSSARQKAGFYSQSKFALKTNIPLSRYVVLERGDDDPTIAELDTISAVAGISLNWLVKG